MTPKGKKGLDWHSLCECSCCKKNKKALQEQAKQIFKDIDVLGDWNWQIDREINILKKKWGVEKD